MKQLKVYLIVILALTIVISTAGCASDSMRSLGGYAGSGLPQPDGSTEFRAYEGPVMPLLTLDGAEGITATRDTVFDFSGFRNISDGWMTRSDIKITDAYTLTNDTENDVAIKILYPFVSNFLQLNRFLPVITSDGVPIETELIAGTYSGGFSGDGDMMQAYNLERIRTWEGYSTLLSDGEYLRRALRGAQELGQIVTVYELRNPRVENGRDAVAPTIAAHFKLDYDKTKILAFGFNGTDRNVENGSMSKSFFVERRGYNYHIPNPYIVAVGDDISGLVIQGYTDGSCSVKLDDVTADVVRYEMALGDVLADILDVFLPAIHESFEANALFSQYIGEIPDAGMLYKAALELLLDYGILSDDAAYRYVWGDVVGIFDDMIWVDRVFYLIADIEIPVGGSVAINVDMTKPGSSTPPGFGTENADIYGYEILTQLGSDVEFRNVTAGIKGENYIQIVWQNFGFDLENGILTTTLDTEALRYYIEVRGR